MEADNPKRLVLQVGAALKRIRKDRKLSLEELANITGVSKLTLGNIERGGTNPTLGVLWKVSKALDIPLMALFENNGKVAISRAETGLRIAGEQKNWVIEPIFHNTEGGMEMCRAYLQPNSSYHPEAHHTNSTEMVTVMNGTISIEVDGAKHRLNQYDSISFPADQKHSYENDTDEVAILHTILKYTV